MSSKRTAEAYESDGGRGDEGPASKKSKGTAKKDKKKSGAAGVIKTDLTMRKNDSGDPYWELSHNRRLTISKFAGRDNVDIREFYEKDGKKLPGKKGISLSMDHFTALLTLLPDVEAVLAKRGVDVIRPDYERDVPDPEESGKGGVGDVSRVPEKRGRKKANIEATSDEDGGGVD